MAAKRPESVRERSTNLGEDSALTAFHLGVGPGQRIGDVLAMKWEHFDGEFISVVQQKTGSRLSIYCPRALQDHVPALPRAGEYILARDLKRPLSYNQADKAVKRVRRAVNLMHLTIHGWRATAAVELRMAGVSLEDIAAIAGHKDLSMVQHYTKDADQKAIGKAAQKRRD